MVLIDKWKYPVPHNVKILSSLIHWYSHNYIFKRRQQWLQENLTRGTLTQSWRDMPCLDFLEMTESRKIEQLKFHNI